MHLPAQAFAIINSALVIYPGNFIFMHILTESINTFLKMNLPDVS